MKPLLLFLSTLIVFTLNACSTSTSTTITLLQINDIYEITPLNAGKTGGMARLASLQKQLKAANPHTYSILAGDLLSPSALGTAVYNGEPLAGKQMIDLFNYLHWDYITFGNHEFDIGKTALLKRLNETNSVFFSSNVTDHATHKPLPHTQTSVVFNVDEVKIGLIGLTVPELKQNFVDIAEPLSAAQAAVASLKQQQVDFIVLVTHLNYVDDIRLAEKLDGIDLIIGGHEHENIQAFRGEHLVPIAKADANAKSAFVHQLSLNKQTGAKQIDSKLVFLDQSLPLDQETDALVKKWQQLAFDLFRQQGFTPERIIAHTHEALDGLEASVRNHSTRLTEIIASAYL